MKTVLNSEQMEALSDPLRSQLVLALRAYGSGSVSDLATRLSKDPKTLYYPLKCLQSAGLVREVGKQRGKRRPESVYALTADQFEISRDTSLEARAKLIKTSIRIAEREFLAAQARESASDALNIIRSQLWLEADAKSAFLARLAELSQEFSERSVVGRGELIHWTSLVSPAS